LSQELALSKDGAAQLLFQLIDCIGPCLDKVTIDKNQACGRHAVLTTKLREHVRGHPQECAPVSSKLNGIDRRSQVTRMLSSRGHLILVLAAA
jgi:hypothetical protein